MNDKKSGRSLMDNRPGMINYLRRHYCCKCGRKRYEGDMKEHGTGKWGRHSWSCNECKDLRIFGS